MQANHGCPISIHAEPAHQKQKTGEKNDQRKGCFFLSGWLIMIKMKELIKKIQEARIQIIKEVIEGFYYAWIAALGSCIFGAITSDTGQSIIGFFISTFGLILTVTIKNITKNKE